jgi:hypothetical protein
MVSRWRAWRWLSSGMLHRALWQDLPTFQMMEAVFPKRHKISTRWSHHHTYHNYQLSLR